MTSYAIKEIFYSLQGEGRNAGRAAVFCRFAGCNLWSGRERDRADAVCTFCDTDFVGTNGSRGGRYGSATELTAAISDAWGDNSANRFVVLTGGEPLLQVDDALIGALHGAGFEIALETNGTLTPPVGIDWICVSPKTLPLALDGGHELKLVYPNPRVNPEDVEDLAFENFLLQPLDGAATRESTEAAVAFCLANPKWRLSLQTHKQLGIR
ncbi:MAG TPA: 7-carboxy-7-deazaguanine synthase [Allosphingosinicella sp.]|uniref:7-carboxy-7-deazaguanine synthase n=1 Tax=Allosphingosinicella sp. TaxID=2823234 RepID=UPI002EDAD31F